jgi:hypothetical protein
MEFFLVCIEFFDVERSTLVFLYISNLFDDDFFFSDFAASSSGGRMDICLSDGGGVTSPFINDSLEFFRFGPLSNKLSDEPWVLTGDLLGERLDLSLPVDITLLGLWCGD